EVPTSCRGLGKCRECLVEVTEGMELLSQRAPQEVHLREGFRLACCSRVEGEEGKIACHTLRRNRMRIEEEGSRGAREGGGDPAVTREGGERVLLEGREIARSREPLHGLAVDIGTTTVVVRLHDLESGQIVAGASFENPQRFAGSDIMARIHYDSERGDHLLQRTLAGYLARAVESFAPAPETIYEAVIAGNSTMRDLFFGLGVATIGREPFRSLTEIECEAGERAGTALFSSPKKLGIPMHPEARVYGMPIVSGHVGADAAACMLAVGMLEEDRTIAIMDLGTNSEVVVGNRQGAIVASCPAGPAFEGGGVGAGMPGLEGAIERVVIDDDGRVEIGVIGGGAPEGICGSGLIDLLSELFRSGRMNARGRFEGGEDCFTVDAEHGIFLRESDINELALAVGANVAGLKIVLNQAGLRPEDIEVFHLAGAFGRHLDLAAAARIGLIPEIEASRFRRAGNAAIEGASAALLSLSSRLALEEMIGRTRHVRLESDPDFFDIFVDGCLFGPF
ncbi:MAG: ASKHA domain-containing protein, partial [Verrucomicrobiales bacterium]